MREQTEQHKGESRFHWRRGYMALLLAAVFLFSGISPGLIASAELYIGQADPFVFGKPTLGSVETKTISGVQKGGKLEGQSGNINYYRIDAAHYPVVAFKQGSYALIWKAENSPWTEADKAAALKDVGSIDGSIGSMAISGWYYGEDFNTAQRTNANFNSNNYGNYYYDASDNHFYLQVDKLSHFDWGADPNWGGSDPNNPHPDDGATITLRKMVNDGKGTTPLSEWWQAKYGQPLDPAVRKSMTFYLYKAAFDGGALTDIVGITTLNESDQIIFLNVEPGWYAVAEELSGGSAGVFYTGEPIYIYVGANSVMGSIDAKNISGNFTVHWSGGYALGLKIVFDDGRSHSGTKPDGSGQAFTTERFDALMPDGSRIATYCADLGAHNIWGNYRFDEKNHNFTDPQMLYLIAAFDFLNENIRKDGNRYSGLNGEQETAICKALAQIVLWNLILQIDAEDHGGYAAAWYKMIYPESEENVKVKKVEGTEWFQWDGRNTYYDGGIINRGYVFAEDVVKYDASGRKQGVLFAKGTTLGDYITNYATLVDLLLDNPRSFVDIYNNKLDRMAGTNEEFVIGAVFIRGDGQSYSSIDQQRQMLVLFGNSKSDSGSSSVNTEYVNKYKPSTSVDIPVNKIVDSPTPPPATAFTFKAEQVDSLGSLEYTGKAARLSGKASTDEKGGAINIKIDGLTPGTHTFMVSEEDRKETGWAYDKHAYWIEVKVTDNKDGTATAAITNKHGSPDFVNYYEYAPGITSVFITGDKIMSGDAYLGPARIFTFLAEQVAGNNSDALVEDGKTGIGTVKVSNEAKKPYVIAVNDLTAGTYWFRVTETTEADDTGWIYDSRVYWVEVLVSDNGDGTATADISETSPVPVFENKYKAPVTEVSISGSKSIAGKYIGSGETFSFHAVQVAAMGSDLPAGSYGGTATVDISGSGVMANNGAFSIGIGDLAPGTYYFMVTEGAGAGEAPGWSYDKHAFWVQINVNDNGDGTATAEISGKSGETEFVNFYEAPTTSVLLTGDKLIEGGNTGPATTFTFNAEQVTAMGGDTAVAGGLTGTGSVTVTDETVKPYAIGISGLEAGVYYFKITEEAGQAGTGWTYDTSAYWAEVTVTVTPSGGDFVISASVTGQSEKTGFINTYKSPATFIVIEGNKTIDNATDDEPENQEFTFNAVQVLSMGSEEAVEGGISGTNTITGEGTYSIKLDGLTAAESPYYFLVTEAANEDEDWTMNDHGYWAQVTVEDNGDETATAEITGESGSPDFINYYMYTPGVTSAIITGDKRISGIYAGEDKTFTFTAVQVTGDGSNEAVEDGASGTGSITGEGTFTIGIGNLTRGTYWFKVTENDESSKGWTYSKQAYWVEVVVKDQGRHRAVATVSYDGGVFVNEYQSDKTSIEITGEKYIAVVGGFSASDQTFTVNASEVTDLGEDTPKDSGLTIAAGTVNTGGVPGKAGVYTINVGNLTVEGSPYYLQITEEQGTADGWTYDESIHWVKIEVTDNGDGTSSADIVGSRVPNFTNSYIGGKTSVTVPLEKTIIGNNYHARRFAFHAEQIRSFDNDAAIGGLRGRASIRDNGSFALSIDGLFMNPDFMVGEECIYYFKIVERAGKLGDGWTYSDNQVMIEVIVRDNGQGGLTASIGEVVGSPVFVNTYVRPPEEKIIVPDDFVPEEYPEFDPEGEQPDPETPGGTDPYVPPVPNDPDSILILVFDDDDNIVFIEIDDDDVPLGYWYYDEDAGEEEDEGLWIFDEDIPLAGWDDDEDDTPVVMPKTGSTPIRYYLLPIGAVLIGAGLFTLRPRKYLPKRLMGR